MYAGDLYIAERDDGYSDYVFQINQMDGERALIVDAARTNTAPGRLINDSKGSNKNANCVFAIDRSHGTTVVRVKTTRAVQAGEECFLNYGKDYWKDKARRDADVPVAANAAVLHEGVRVQQVAPCYGSSICCEYERKSSR